MLTIILSSSATPQATRRDHSPLRTHAGSLGDPLDQLSQLTLSAFVREQRLGAETSSPSKFRAQAGTIEQRSQAVFERLDARFADEKPGIPHHFGNSPDWSSKDGRAAAHCLENRNSKSLELTRLDIDFAALHQRNFLLPRNCAEEDNCIASAETIDQLAKLGVAGRLFSSDH